MFFKFVIVYQSHELSLPRLKDSNSHPMLGTVPKTARLYRPKHNISESAHCSMDLFIYLFIYSLFN